MDHPPANRACTIVSGSCLGRRNGCRLCGVREAGDRRRLAVGNLAACVRLGFRTLACGLLIKSYYIMEEIE
ncbi:hypothetical protein D3C73_1655360 [compost metagenome]